MADIFSDILGFVGTAVNQALTGDNLRDYTHASKLFVGDNYKFAPKMGFLYHVAFDINREVADQNNETGERFVRSIAYPDLNNPHSNYELGMMVKSVGLPKFSIDTKNYNAYNRPNIVQSKIKYDPVQISFHDDSADVVRNFWYDYFNYYYRDSDYNESLYQVPHKYNQYRQATNWGYTPRDTTGIRYLNSIRLYSLHQKRFSEYVLINPVIKSFAHGQHTAGESSLMQHDMTIEYESVLYFYGSVSSNTVKGFAELHYDRTPSPLTVAGGGTQSIGGQGGLLETADDVIYDLQQGNFGSAIFKAARGIKNASNMNLKQAAIGELLGLGTSILRGNNPSSSIYVPSMNSGIGGLIGGIGSSLSGTFNGLGNGGSGSLLASVAAGSAVLFSGKQTTTGLPILGEEGNVVEGIRTNPETGETYYTEAPSNQFSIDASAQRTSNNRNSAVVANLLESTKNDLGESRNQVQMATDAQSFYNAQIQTNLANGASPDSPIIRQLRTSADTQATILAFAQQRVSKAQDSLATLTEQQQQYQYDNNSLA